MPKRFPRDPQLPGSLLGAVALLAAGLMLVTPAHAQPAGPSPRPAARPAPRTPTASPPARKVKPKAAGPRRKAQPPAAAPRKKRARLAPRRQARPTPADERRRAATTPRPREIPPQDKETQEKPLSRLQGIGWTLVGITAMLLTVTGVFALMVEDREDEMERMASFLDPYSKPHIFSGRIKRDFDTYQKEGQRFEIAAFTFLGLSAATAATAVTLFIIDAVTRKNKPKKTTWRLRPMLGPKGAGISMGLEF